MIYSLRSKLWAFVALATIGLVSCAPKKTIDLKLKLAKGESYHYLFDFDINQSFMGQKMNTKMAMGFAMKITGDDGTYKTMQAFYDRISMSMHTPQMDITVDTDQPAPTQEDIAKDPTKIMSVMFHAMKGLSFSMKVTEKGEVKEITGLEQMIDSMVASVTNNLTLPEAQLATIKESARSQFNEESLKDMMQQSFNNYPDKPVAVGDTWTKHVSTKGALKIQMDNTYTLKSVEGDNAIIDMKSKVKTLTGGNGLSGDQTARLVIDLKTGMTSSCNILQDMKGKVNGTDMALTSKATITGKQ